jgi:fission 1 protein
MVVYLPKYALFIDIYDSDQTWRRDSLYYLALAHFKLGEFNHARKYARFILDKEPKNQQMKLLIDKIDDKSSSGKARL